MSQFDVAIIGGGFYGCSLALELASFGKSVILFESGSRLLGRASYANQARIHGGYHYPRSFLTGTRSRQNFKLFLEKYKNAVVSDFTKLYAIALNSNVTAKQFSEFCARIGAPVSEASPKYAKLFSTETIEKVFEVQEYAFDSVKLANLLGSLLNESKVTVRLNYPVNKVVENSDKTLNILGQDSSGTYEGTLVETAYLVTYSNLNEVLSRSGFPLIPLRHELAEMALVSVPENLKNISITVMDGPFWSLMPFPSRSGLSTLSHVRYTPHAQWSDTEMKYSVTPEVERKSSFLYMQKDAQRFVPAMQFAKYDSSLWETKTILPRSDTNDSRPILFRKNHGCKGLHVVLGGKIDNVFDIIDMMKQESHE